MTHDPREAQHAVERIILRRIYERRIEGYTIETAKEIVGALTASPGEQEPPPAVGDEATKSKGGPLNWQLSDDAKARIAEIDANRRHAALNAGNIVAGSPTPSDPTAERREIVARLLRNARLITSVDRLRVEIADVEGLALAILAALDGGR